MGGEWLTCDVKKLREQICHGKCALKCAIIMWFLQHLCLSADVQKLGQQVSRNEDGKCLKRKRGMADVRTTGSAGASEVSGVESSLSLATSSAIAH